jgi:DNA-binding helix-turn-helix protein
MANKINTSKSNISILESLNSEISPTISTLNAYDNAAGYKLDVNFVQ